MLATVNEVAQLVAVDIERFGHYKGAGSEYNRSDRPQGQCCVVMNPTIRTMRTVSPAAYRSVLEFEEALEDFIGGDIVIWSDTTPTPEVLDTLRNLR